MNREFASLDHHSLSSDAKVARPSAPRLTQDSAALEAMTDLRRIRAASIAPDRTIDECNALMLARGIRLLFVEGDAQTIAGVITATDLLGEKPIRFMRERGVRHSEVLVADVMTPASALQSLDFRSVAGAKVGHIVATLKAVGRQHTFVTEDDGRSVCGIFSASEIARRLGIELQTPEVANTFAQIERALAR